LKTKRFSAQQVFALFPADDPFKPHTAFQKGLICAHRVAMLKQGEKRMV
jgi:hypothetical protein